MLAAMVLAAGLGTRLRPLTERLAKPLVPVGDRPAIAHVLGRLRAAGFERIVVNAHHHAAQVAGYLAVEAPSARVSIEGELLGTAGGLARASALLGEGAVVVCNGDVLAQVDLAALVSARAGLASMVVQPRPRGQGSVGVDAAGRVVRLRARAVADEVEGGEYLGTAVLEPALRAKLPPAGCLVGDALIPALEAGAEVRAWRHEGPWHDIGTIDGYLDANAAWLDARGVRAWIGDAARVDAGVVLDRTVVGAGAVVTGSGAVTGSVVWPGGRATAPLARAVVTS